MSDETAERVARAMHDAYEKAAVAFGWATQESCRVSFDDLPEANRMTMLASARAAIEAMASTDNVRKLELVTVGDGAWLDPDQLLEAAKGRNFGRLAIIAENPDGTIWVSGSAGTGDTVVLLELAKHQIIHGAP
jgi:hypothetical protein